MIYLTTVRPILKKHENGLDFILPNVTSVRNARSGMRKFMAPVDPYSEKNTSITMCKHKI